MGLTSQRISFQITLISENLNVLVIEDHVNLGFSGAVGQRQEHSVALKRR